MRYQVLAGIHPAGHHIEHTRRHAALLGGFCENHCIERCFRCRLEHHRAAGCQRRGELECGEGLRVVPRDNRRDDTHRLAANDGVADHARPDLLDWRLGDELGVITQQRRRE